MAVDVVIRSGLLHRKPLPLSVILGENLCYGNYVNDNLLVDEMGEGDFVALHPEHIGRGISVTWQEGERREAVLSLPMPSTSRELTELFDMIRRIVKFWHGYVFLDGNPCGILTLEERLEDMIAFNHRAIRDMAERLLGEPEMKQLLLYSAAWPLYIGETEARRFSEDPEAYAGWLHDRQQIDAWHAGAEYSLSTEGVEGCYNYIDGLPAIFRWEPQPPFGAMHPETGEPLQVERWVVTLHVGEWDNEVGTIPYDAFLAALPQEKVHPYDAGGVLVDALSAEEVRALVQ